VATLGNLCRLRRRVVKSETNFDTQALYTLNPLNRFSDRAADYVKYRPSYPAVAIDRILAGLGTEPLVADIGAGTGISSRLIADRGVRVMAINPNAAMRTAAAAHHFTNVQEFTFANHQELDLAGLIGRVRSNSYTPQAGVIFDRLMLDLKQLFDRFVDDRGLVSLKYSTSLHLAEL
jgi:2-polyprenyl-3-methyl-5-hydroxy-6-metoxy-1,4-benzoquinol methylase